MNSIAVTSNRSTSPFVASGAEFGGMFLKNVSIVGGFLLLAAHGAGAWSIDGLRGR